MATTSTVNFTDMLDRAITDPGTISTAYSLFHGYSLGNQLLAMMQCASRNIEPGPIACFNRWKELGRHVRKGEKAIELCMPITGKRTTEHTDETGQVTTEEATFQRFVFRRNWFTLSQTEGEPFTPPTMPDWNRTRALTALQVTEEAFGVAIARNGDDQIYVTGESWLRPRGDPERSYQRPPGTEIVQVAGGPAEGRLEPAQVT